MAITVGVEGPMVIRDPVQVRCQVCLKPNHTAKECWHRFDEDYVPKERFVAAAAPSYGVDTNWYTDSGSTDHITSNLGQLHAKEKYSGSEQIHTANGVGMGIKHIGHSVFSSSARDLHLNNILHVPEAKKNLISVHRFTTDNRTFLEFYPNYFLVKDQETKQILLQGKCKGGLYPFPS